MDKEKSEEIPSCSTCQYAELSFIQYYCRWHKTYHNGLDYCEKWIKNSETLNDDKYDHMWE